MVLFFWLLFTIVEHKTVGYNEIDLKSHFTLIKELKGDRTMLLSLSLIFNLLIKWPLMILFGPLGLLF